VVIWGFFLMQLQLPHGLIYVNWGASRVCLPWSTFAFSFPERFRVGGIKREKMMDKWPTIEMCLGPSCITPLLVGKWEAKTMLNESFYYWGVCSIATFHVGLTFEACIGFWSFRHPALRHKISECIELAGCRWECYFEEECLGCLQWCNSLLWKWF